MRHFRAFVVFAFCFIALAACRQAWAQELAKIEPLSISTETASTLFAAEIADTPDLRARGLMFRHVLPPDRAMLFDFGDPKPAAMWMKNTYISLDMLFVREDGSIAAIAEKTEPLSLQTISVQEPVRGVVELAAGTVEKLGIQRGDQVVHRIFANPDP
jgi:hypothetical protein